MSDGEKNAGDGRSLTRVDLSSQCWSKQIRCLVDELASLTDETWYLSTKFQVVREGSSYLYPESTIFDVGQREAV